MKEVPAPSHLLRVEPTAPSEVQAAGLSEPALALKGALEKMERATPGFVCEQCGFTPRNRFWQCPACRQWGSIHRVSDRFGA